MKPLHIAGTSRANWTLCGIRIKTKEALPYCIKRYAQQRADRGVLMCPECWNEMKEDQT